MHAHFHIAVYNKAKAGGKENGKAEHDNLFWKCLGPEYVPNPEIKYASGYIRNDPVPLRSQINGTNKTQPLGQ
jgi:hypothetical protein